MNSKGRFSSFFRWTLIFPMKLMLSPNPFTSGGQVKNEDIAFS